MNIILILALTLAVAMTAVTILNKKNLIRLRDDLTVLQEKLNEREKEKALLEEELSQIGKSGGVGESTILALIGEMSRIDNNLYHMQDVPGRKQIVKALERMKVSLQAEDYTKETQYWGTALHDFASWYQTKLNIETYSLNSKNKNYIIK